MVSLISVRPYRLERRSVAWTGGGYVSSWAEGFCRVCGRKTIWPPGRLWLNVLWVPLVPLGLTLMCEGCETSSSDPASAGEAAAYLHMSPGGTFKPMLPLPTYLLVQWFWCVAFAGVGYLAGWAISRALHVDMFAELAGAIVGWLIGVCLVLHIGGYYDARKEAWIAVAAGVAITVLVGGALKFLPA